MPKFFSDDIKDDKIFISGEDVVHISKVLRLKENDEILVCDKNGYDYRAKIVSISKDLAECEILEKFFCQTEPELKVFLYQGLPKATKMDYIIQKTTELGISGIVPCYLNRCVVKLEGRKQEEKKVERWEKISLEAAKQSGRGIIPEVSFPLSLDEAIEKLKGYDLSFVLYENEENKNFKRILNEKDNIKTLGFIVGPEGGFEEWEIEKLQASGIHSVGLGKRILRTETAGEAALSMIMYEIGDINK